MKKPHFNCFDDLTFANSASSMDIKKHLIAKINAQWFIFGANNIMHNTFYNEYLKKVKR